MEDITYHVVKETDYKRILELYRAAGWWEMDDDPRHHEKVAKIVQNTFCFVIAKIGEEIVGMGRAISDGHSDAYLQDITVDKAHRGKGIGKGIVRKLVSFLKDNKMQWIGLISEPGYEKFYNELGFSEMKGYTPFLLK
ncbi:MAG: GNAT family N-acetyltransferase [Candidatus Cloacimonetes bacterium]|nr:GNAT family N-acetyltransferase [Candidatus Cloacimonadota bacterium]